LDVPVLFNNQGELRGAMVIKRIRMYPVDGGPSVAGKAVINDPLRRTAIQLLESLDWRGVAMVEFKVDERDGIPKLMEINPRFWGSTQLAISSGMDFPWMLYEAVLKGDCEIKMDYRTDRLVRWLIPGDIMHFLTRKKRRELWPDFFRFFDANTEYYFFRKDDFMPFVGLFRPRIDMYFIRVLLQKFLYF
jgi:predicted ATP-grasp superfamily ATP-dependent carboligase